jgi:pilus assembly protein CpaE
MIYDANNNPEKTIDALLPRLNIAIYSLNNHLSEIAGQLMIDRRFTNSKISVFSGGVMAAINYYKDNLTPDLIIIEFSSDLNEMMHDLSLLSEVCDVKTRVIIAGQINDVTVYRELIRNGIAEYLVLPTTTTALINAISNLYNDKNSVPLAPSVTFVGAGGGVGTSIIAQSIALSLANNYNTDTIFIDLDTTFPLANLSWSVEESSKNITALIQNAQGYVDDTLLRSCLVKVSDNVTLLTSTSDPLYQHDDSHDDLLSDMIKASKRLSDFTIIDIPSGLLNIEKRIALLNSTHIVIVTEPTIKSIRNLGVLYYAIQSMRPNDAAPFIILNKVNPDSKSQLDIQTIIDNTGITPDMSIPFMDNVTDMAIAQGIPVASLDDTEEFNLEIQRLTCLLIGKEFNEDEEEDSKLGNLFKNFKKKIGL